MGKTNRKEGGEGIALGMLTGALISVPALVPVTVEYHQTPPDVHVTEVHAEVPHMPQVQAVEKKAEPEVVADDEEPAKRTHIDALIDFYADEYDVNAATMHRVISCETGGTYDPKIQSYVIDPTGPNGREDSWGLSQIHLPAHTYVTREEAQDENFALEFMAKKFSEGEHHIWTCWHLTK